MSFSLPNPDSPTNGQPLDASPILANLVAIQEAIDSFDGSQIESKSIVETALADAINPRLRADETIANFVYSGCVWAAVSGFTATMTGGTIYVNGFRVIVSGVGSETFAASEDTYIDIDDLGNITYQGVSNGSAAPALTANSIRVAKVITSGSAVSSVVQVGSDSLGDIIYPIGAASAKGLQNPVKFSVYWLAGEVAYLNASGETIKFETKSFDTGDNYSTSTFEFTAPINGFYLFTTQVGIDAGSTIYTNVALLKNGSAIAEYADGATSGSQTNPTPAVTKLVQCAAGDTISVQAFTQNSGIGVNGGITQTFFDGFLVSAT